MFGTRKLGKTSAQRKALLRQQVTALAYGANIAQRTKIVNLQKQGSGHL